MVWPISLGVASWPYEAGNRGRFYSDSDSSLACGDSTGEPILNPPRDMYETWIKIEPPGVVCGNNTPYKFFVNFSDKSDNLVVVLEPGGACWDYDSCTGNNGIRGAANVDGLQRRSLQARAVHLAVPQSRLDEDPDDATGTTSTSRTARATCTRATTSRPTPSDDGTADRRVPPRRPRRDRTDRRVDRRQLHARAEDVRDRLLGRRRRLARRTITSSATASTRSRRATCSTTRARCSRRAATRRRCTRRSAAAWNVDSIGADAAAGLHVRGHGHDQHGARRRVPRRPPRDDVLPPRHGLLALLVRALLQLPAEGRDPADVERRHAAADRRSTTRATTSTTSSRTGATSTTATARRCSRSRARTSRRRT